MKQFKWKLSLILGIVVLASIYVVPSLYSTVPDWWTALRILPSEKIHLGLDLQGGVHLVLEVQVEKAVENRIERTAEELRDAMKKEGVRQKYRFGFQKKKALRPLITCLIRISACFALYPEPLKGKAS